MKTSFLLILVSLLIFFISSCDRKNTYKYEQGLLAFNDEVLGFDIDFEKSTILLYVDISCVDCSSSKLDFLSDLDTPIKIILLGDTSNNIIYKSIQNPIYAYDIERKYSYYETGISLPTLVSIKNGDILGVLSVNSFNQEEAKTWCANINSSQ